MGSVVGECTKVLIVFVGEFIVFLMQNLKKNKIISTSLFYNPWDHEKFIP